MLLNDSLMIAVKSAIIAIKPIIAADLIAFKRAIKTPKSAIICIFGVVTRRSILGHCFFWTSH